MHRPYQNITIRDALLLTTGIAAAFGLFAPQFKDFAVSKLGDWLDALCVPLGGLSLVGVPLLLWHRRKDPRRWGPGRLFWFATGVMILFVFSVLLVHQFRNPKGTPPQGLMNLTTVRPTGATQRISGTNLFYPLGILTMQGQPVDRAIIIARLLHFLAVPLFAPAWLLAILATRHLRPAFKRTSPWTERFGLLLCVAWTCAGLLCLCNLAMGGPFFVADFAGEQLRIEWNGK